MPNHIHLQIGLLAQVLNESVNQRARRNNNSSEKLMRILSEDPNYRMPEIDRKKTEIYRHGLCGEACDAVKSSLEDNGVSTESIHKIQPNPEHFYLADNKSDLIIDPTYKQFFYRLLIDTNTGGLKENVTRLQVSIIDEMPPIFIGSLIELKLKISETLEKIGKKSEMNGVLKIWNIPTGKAEEEYGINEDNSNHPWEIVELQKQKEFAEQTGQKDKILQSLHAFNNKIAGIGEHNSEAKEVAVILHENLIKLVNESLGNKQHFLTQTKALIDKAIPTLQRDLGLGDYLANLAKEICNTVTKAVSLGFHGGFFDIKKSDAAKEAEKLQDEVLSAQSFLEIK